MTNDIKENYEQTENDDFDGEVNDKDSVLESLKFSALPLLYMTEDNQKATEFYRRADEINGMANA